MFITAASNPPHRSSQPMIFHPLRLSNRRSRSTIRLHSMMTTLLCAAVFVGAVGPAQAMVVCVGTNGHIDVEMALGSCCSAPQVQESHTGLHCKNASHCCSGCTDHELSTPLKRYSSQRLRPPRPCFTEILSSAMLEVSSANFNEPIEYSASPPPPLPALLASIILLI